MQPFFITLNQLIIMSSLAAAGYYIEKKRFISKETTKGLSFILVNVCMPALIFSSIQAETGRAPVSSALLSGVIYAVVMLTGYYVSMLATHILGITGDERKVWLCGGLMFNSIFIGFPITTALFGERAGLYLVLGSISYNVLAFTLGISIFTGSLLRGNLVSTVIQIIKMPAITSCIVSSVFFVLHVNVHPTIFKTFSYAAQMTTPLSMIILGALISREPLRIVFGGKNVYIFSAIRLIIVPIIAILIFKWTVPVEMAKRAVILSAGMPVGATVAVYAEQYGDCGELGAKYNVVTTLLAIITLPILSVVVASV